jgi:hypothetical protein
MPKIDRAIREMHEKYYNKVHYLETPDTYFDLDEGIYYEMGDDAYDNVIEYGSIII